MNLKEEEQEMDKGLQAGLDILKIGNITQEQLDSLITLNKIFSAAIIELITLKNKAIKASFDTPGLFTLAPDYEDYILELNVYYNSEINKHVARIELMKPSEVTH